MSQEKGPDPSTSLPSALAGLREPQGDFDDIYARSKNFSGCAAKLDDLA